MTWPMTQPILMIVRTSIVNGPLSPVSNEVLWAIIVANLAYDVWLCNDSILYYQWPSI